MASSCCSSASFPGTVPTQAGEHTVTCKWDACNQAFPEAQALVHHLLVQHIDWQPKSRSAGLSEHPFRILNITISADATQSSIDKDAAATCQNPDSTFIEKDKPILGGRLPDQRRISQNGPEHLGTKELHNQSAQYVNNVRNPVHNADLNRTNSITDADTLGSQRCLDDHPRARTVLPSIDKLFPPMARSPPEYPFNDSRCHDEETVKTDKTKKRHGRLRRKWSEQEKNALIKGIEKHGLGNWTMILNDEEFVFDNRTATDLKDKFRTCYTTRLVTKDLGTQQPDVLTLKDNSSAESHDEQASTPDGGGLVPSKHISMSALNTGRPLKRSRRRERRPFGDRDDKEILEGLRRYGPAWSQIQRDANFHLLCRRPLDLRDRVRNRFPDLYKRLKKNLSQQRNQKQQAQGDAAREFEDLG